jgi:hypothetical protein
MQARKKSCIEVDGIQEKKKRQIHSFAGKKEREKENLEKFSQDSLKDSQ